MVRTTDAARAAAALFCKANTLRWTRFLIPWPGLAIVLPLVLSGCLHWAPPDYPGVQPGKDYVVTVRDGETYWSIAKRLNLSLDELLAINKARPPYQLYPGDRLLLPDPAFHIVGPNETLISIAHRYDVDYDKLAELNGIRNPAQIRPGVKLRLPNRWSERRSEVGSDVRRAEPKPQPEKKRWFWQRPQEEPPPSSSRAPSRAASRAQARTIAARSPVRFSWPVRGRVISDFGAKSKGVYNDGINIATLDGAPILAAAGGVVIYRGNLVPGFGKLVLVKHGGGLVTAYAHLGAYNVREGDRVTGGQLLGWAGTTGNVTTPQLHFEVRRGTTAIDPMPFLSRRS